MVPHPLVFVVASACVFGLGRLGFGFAFRLLLVLRSGPKCDHVYVCYFGFLLFFTCIKMFFYPFFPSF